MPDLIPQPQPSNLKVSIFSGLIRLLTIAPNFFLGLHFSNIKFSGLQIGIIFAANTIASLLCMFPFGLSTDRAKIKNLITIGLALASLQYLALAYVHNFYIVALFLLLGGLGTTLNSIATDSLFLKSTGKEKASQKIGVYNGFKFFFIATGMMLTGYLLSINISFENFFLILSGAFLSLAIAAQLLFSTNQISHFEVIHYKKDIFQPKVLTFLLVVFLFAIHFGAESTSYALFLKNNLGLNKLQTGFYMGLAILPMTLTVLLIPKALHKWKVSKLLLTGLFISGSGHILMTTSDPGLSLAFRVYHEIGDAMTFFFIFYGMSKLFKTERMGGNSSTINLAAFTGGAVGSIIFGPIGEKYGYHLPFILSGISTITAAGITLYFLHHFHHEHSSDRT